MEQFTFAYNREGLIMELLKDIFVSAQNISPQDSMAKKYAFLPEQITEPKLQQIKKVWSKMPVMTIVLYHRLCLSFPLFKRSDIK